LRLSGRGHSARAREEEGEGGRDKRIDRKVCVSSETRGVINTEEGVKGVAGRFVWLNGG
jgi:hypothetical protein